MRALLPGIFLAAFLLVYGPVAMAQALYSVPLAEKVSHSTLIAEGKVVSQMPFWNPQHTMIFTSNRLKIYKVFQGNVSEEFIEVLTQGGAIGNVQIEASDLLQLQVGEEGLFFCYPNDLSIKSPVTGKVLYDVYSSAQGGYKYNTLRLTTGVPFDNYSSITQGLYHAVTALTGKGFTDYQPTISFGPKPVIKTPATYSVTNFSPKVVNAGALLQTDSNLLTITGSGFGTPSGSAAILFYDADGSSSSAPYALPATSSLVVSWTDNQIKVKVPTRAGTGFFSVRKSDNSFFTSPEILTVNYAVQAVTFPDDHVLQSNLMSTNGQGGYNIVYSTSTANGGRDLSTAPEKAPFQRALATWKEICGADIREAGNTNVQVVDGSDNVNTIMLDNTQTSVPPLASGVLAITYSFNNTCHNGNDYNFPAVKTGFDMVIRNQGVSSGNTPLTVGPCPPATNIVQTDLETIILHELGHAINLGHINDNFQGSQLPNVNPAKVMNYSIANGVKRVSLDQSAKSGGDYCVSRKGLTFGSCSFTTPMQPLSTIIDPKDNCPLNFSTISIINNTQLAFELAHTTSNVKVDPQYTAFNCNGTGTGITNTAFTVVRTGNTAGTLNISVSGFVTTPANQVSCPNAGVEMALYKVNSCPGGQSFPAPTVCRTFSGNGAITAINGLDVNSNYLLVVDGIDNTKAAFTLTFSGAVLPAAARQLTGAVQGAANVLSWNYTSLPGVTQVVLERSSDGITFENVMNWNIADFNLAGNYTDQSPPSNAYYRLRFSGTAGTEYTNLVNLKHDETAGWRIYPNPAIGTLNILGTQAEPGDYTVQLFASNGMLLASQKATVVSGGQKLQFPVGIYPNGSYRVVVFNSSGKRIFQDQVVLMR